MTETASVHLFLNPFFRVVSPRIGAEPILSLGQSWWVQQVRLRFGREVRTLVVILLERGGLEGTVDHGHDCARLFRLLSGWWWEGRSNVICPALESWIIVRDSATRHLRLQPWTRRATGTFVQRRRGHFSEGRRRIELSPSPSENTARQKIAHSQGFNEGS
jgi:hypothetical protein